MLNTPGNICADRNQSELHQPFGKQRSANIRLLFLFFTFSEKVFVFQTSLRKLLQGPLETICPMIAYDSRSLTQRRPSQGVSRKISLTKLIELTTLFPGLPSRIKNYPMDAPRCDKQLEDLCWTTISLCLRERGFLGRLVARSQAKCALSFDPFCTLKFAVIWMQRPPEWFARLGLAANDCWCSLSKETGLRLIG